MGAVCICNIPGSSRFTNGRICQNFRNNLSQIMISSCEVHTASELGKPAPGNAPQRAVGLPVFDTCSPHIGGPDLSTSNLNFDFCPIFPLHIYLFKEHFNTLALKITKLEKDKTV
ncbi:phosphoinositide 3-kinase regulatory subunit 4 [Platysternon megacephalum]|uniref:Phosphoinositide 3-kinase regulatory subunit 4 n=1 Tax=Platysternon megacephalum TaxID=55544 RepID=A0A4D9ELU5_9SAUR|nr:phosphoinositide 3-kinase regulatory subunit 4 [Platysternon megacephalum]